MLAIVARFTTLPAPFLFLLDYTLSQYSSLNFEITIFNFNYFFVIIKQLISLIIWIKSTRSSLDSSLTSTFYQLITTMDSNYTTDDSSRNLMHQTNDKMCIGENA